MKELSKNVAMLCPLCGNDMFSTDEENLTNDTDETIYRCAECQSKYSHEELIQANNVLIENTRDEIVDEILSDFQKQWKKAMRKWTR